LLIIKVEGCGRAAGAAAACCCGGGGGVVCRGAVESQRRRRMPRRHRGVQVFATAAFFSAISTVGPASATPLAERGMQGSEGNGAPVAAGELE